MDYDFTRRDVLKSVGIGAMAIGLGSFYGTAYAAEGASKDPEKSDIPVGECKLPPLPYAYDALEPFIDKQTLTIHHDKHHAGYVKGLNEAIHKLAEARSSGDFSLIKHWSKELAFNGSGHILHTLYWGNLSLQGGEPDGNLLNNISRSFGGVDKLRLQFAAAAKSVEGSGWSVLAYEPFMGSLVILQAEKHQDLTLWGCYPLLVCDVWEHAYYLKYQNNRGEYVDNFMKIINWKEVARRYDMVSAVRF